MNQNQYPGRRPGSVQLSLPNVICQMLRDKDPHQESLASHGPGPRQGNPGFAAETALPHHPLTIAQSSIVLDALYLPNSPAANTGDIAQIDGAVDGRMFAEACRRVVDETAAMRALFRHRDGKLS